MSEEEDKRKIVRLMKETTPKKPRTRKTPSAPKATNVIKISGNGNYTAGGDLHVHQAEPAPARPKVIVQTGVGVIDAKQKANLKAKLEQYVTARNLIRVDKMTVGGGWAAMNASVGVNSYHEMTPEHYKRALTWLKRQRAILRSMNSAPIKDTGFRNDMIGAIKARSKQLGDLSYYRPYIAQRYGVSSLKDLSDRQLQELRAWIMQQRR